MREVKQASKPVRKIRSAPCWFDLRRIFNAEDLSQAKAVLKSSLMIVKYFGLLLEVGRMAYSVGSGALRWWSDFPFFFFFFFAASEFRPQQHFDCGSCF
jgi:hypothetical protein